MKKNALLFVNTKKNAAVDLAEKIRSVLESRNYEAGVFSLETKRENYNPASAGQTSVNAASEKRDSTPNISICLGGDGTVLFTSRIMAGLGVPVLPVNLGTLGFISAVSPSQWEETFNQWENGRAVISRRLMLDVIVERNGKTVFKNCCLNDVVVSGAGIAKLVRLEVEAETAAGDKLNLGHFRADGLIVSTPTGSTGYSVAAGGPIIDPEMETVIINPVCPFTLANRPIVLPSEDRIITIVEPEQRSDVLLTVDGQITEPLESGDRVITCRSAQPLRLIASDRWAFYRALRTKFFWPGGESNA